MSFLIEYSLATTLLYEETIKNRTLYRKMLARIENKNIKNAETAINNTLKLILARTRKDIGF